MNKQTKRMNAIFYALLAQTAFVAAAPAQAPAQEATASLKRKTTANDQGRDAAGK